MANMVNVFVWLAELLLALRVVLKFAVAEADASFVDWAFRASDPLLDPFRAVFTSDPTSGSWVVDFPALFAMAVYAAGGYVLVSWANRLAAGRK
jgi:hypothetical protein